MTGVAGGAYLGQDQEVQQQTVEARLVVQADAAEMDLLKERHAQHAAARAPQRKAEADAAEKAAKEAKAAASKARSVEKKVIERKADEKAAVEREKAEGSSAEGSSSASGATVPFTGPIPDSCNEYSGNRRTGCAVLLQKGFDLGQMPCLDKLWKKESGWNHKATNRSSGAYGIPQSLPGSKMKSAGADWKTNPATQIKWGLGYIKGRYGTPCGAWSHSQSNGWY